MFPVAIVCGNTYVIKPSERDPGACMMLLKMAQDSGLPDGVVNVIHGARDGKGMKTPLKQQQQHIRIIIFFKKELRILQNQQKLNKIG